MVFGRTGAGIYVYGVSSAPTAHLPPEFENCRDDPDDGSPGPRKHNCRWAFSGVCVCGAWRCGLVDPAKRPGAAGENVRRGVYQPAASTEGADGVDGCVEDSHREKTGRAARDD